MIESIELRNFQAHSRLKIECESIVVCVGRSDIGKSSILRAVRWALTNKPSGDDFKRRGKKKVGVRLVVDGISLIREKGTRNRYALGSAEFASFGNEIPDPIRAVTRVDHVNFQNQMDAPFWFNLTPGELASELNAVVDLSDIDAMLDWLSKKTRKAKTTTDVLSSRIEETKRKIKELEWADQAAVDWDKVGVLEEKWKSLASDSIRVSGLIAQASRCNKSVLELQQLSGLAEIAIERGSTFRELESEVSSLKKQIEKVDRAETKLESHRERLSKLEDELGEVRNCPLCERPFPIQQ